MAQDPVTAVLNIGGQLIDRLFPDPAAAMAAKIELIKMGQNGDLAQIGVNTAEAANPRLFVAGWRPFIGWVCGCAFAWNWLGLPIANFVSTFMNHPMNVAQADMSEMMPILIGMLGLSGMRSWDKKNNIDTK